MLKCNNLEIANGNVAILGLGLLGGSIAKKIKELNSRIEIDAIVRRAGSAIEALNDGIVDLELTFDQVNYGKYDLIIIAVPVENSILRLREVLQSKNLKKTAIITDVGSVKGAIICQLEDLSNVGQFIPVHPMAGIEKSGYQNSSAHLFEGTSVIITPLKQNKLENIKIIEKIWSSFSTQIIKIDPFLHDKLICSTSHLPHALSVLLTNSAVCSFDDLDLMKMFIGGGFTDMSRLAGGSVEMWKEIFLLNKDNMIKSIEKFQANLEKLKENLDNENENALCELLKNAQDERKEIFDE